MKALIHQNHITHRLIYLFILFCFFLFFFLFVFFLFVFFLFFFFVKRYHRLSDSQAETQFTDEVTAITFKYMSICTSVQISLDSFEYSCLKQYQTVNNSYFQDLYLHLIVPSILKNVPGYKNFRIGKASAFFISFRLTSFLSPEIYETIFNVGIDKEKKRI